MNERNTTRPPIESAACVNLHCDLYGQKGRHNLTIRKVYGQDQIRYLRCRCCQEEFSERKNTALWNSKIPETKAVSVAEHLADGCGFKSTARLVSAAQVRKTLAFAKRGETKEAMVWWGMTVYNWCRAHRSLKRLLAEPMGKKSMNKEHRLWRLV